MLHSACEHNYEQEGVVLEEEKVREETVLATLTMMISVAGR